MHSPPHLPPAVADIVEVLGRLPGTVAVVLGGSRALGTVDASRDWDLGLYYRGTIDLTALAARGTVHPPGSWGRLMNGGAWLQCDGDKSTFTALDDVQSLFARTPEVSDLVQWVDIVANQLGVGANTTSPWTDAGRKVGGVE